MLLIALKMVPDICNYTQHALTLPSNVTHQHEANLLRMSAQNKPKYRNAN